MLVISGHISTQENNNTFIETKRELLSVAPLITLFKTIRYILRVPEYYGKIKEATDLVNWLITEAENYVDQQCQNAQSSQQQYCCLNDQFLQCKNCCPGPRPNSTSLQFSPAPSPSP
ncbi:hypothetical protein OWV82_012199 [Melia azedarach]|uniref:Uncharacterized protein n=1 Tax=Melia azedarach TaxID=155640 RepID=A0ACC1Y2P6_MELAZ|nr:hypothetical protein OWV82_012199 [Melia azedarach]